MSYLKISDSETISIDHLFINYIHVYNTNRTIAEYVEVIKKDTTIRLKIKEDFKNFILDSEINKNNNNIKKVQDWKEVCYEFSKDIIENEINFFKQRNKENIVKLYQELKELNQKDSPLLRIGKYKGKISQTLVLLSQKNECLRTSFPKTRRLVDNSIPLGWIKLEKILQKT
jgi:CRISPR type III-A-associated RAMP protein Csm5